MSASHFLSRRRMQSATRAMSAGSPAFHLKRRSQLTFRAGHITVRGVRSLRRCHPVDVAEVSQTFAAQLLAFCFVKPSWRGGIKGPTYRLPLHARMPCHSPAASALQAFAPDGSRCSFFERVMVLRIPLHGRHRLQLCRSISARIQRSVGKNGSLMGASGNS